MSWSVRIKKKEQLNREASFEKKRVENEETRNTKTEKTLFIERRALILDIFAARKHLSCELFRLLIFIYCCNSLFP